MVGTAPIITAPIISIPILCLEEDNAEDWLFKCEAIFEKHNVVESKKKYLYALRGLPTTLLIGTILDVIRNPPAIDPYKRLRWAVLNQLGKEVKQEPTEEKQELGKGVKQEPVEEKQGPAEEHEVIDLSTDDEHEQSVEILDSSSDEVEAMLRQLEKTAQQEEEAKLRQLEKALQQEPTEEKIELSSDEEEELSSDEEEELSSDEEEELSSDEEEEAMKGPDQPGSSGISINIRSTTINVDNRGGRRGDTSINIDGRGGTSRTTSEIHRGRGGGTARGGAGKVSSGIHRGRGGRVTRGGTGKTASRIRRECVGRATSIGGRGGAGKEDTRDPTGLPLPIKDLKAILPRLSSTVLKRGGADREDTRDPTGLLLPKVILPRLSSAELERYRKREDNRGEPEKKKKREEIVRPHFLLPDIKSDEDALENAVEGLVRDLGGAGFGGCKGGTGNTASTTIGSLGGAGNASSGSLRGTDIIASRSFEGEASNIAGGSRGGSGGVVPFVCTMDNNSPIHKKGYLLWKNRDGGTLFTYL